MKFEQKKISKKTNHELNFRNENAVAHVEREIFAVTIQAAVQYLETFDKLVLEENLWAGIWNRNLFVEKNRKLVRGVSSQILKFSL